MRAPGIRHYLAILVLAAFLPVAGLALALFALSMRSEYEVAWQRAEARTTFIAAAIQTQMDALAGTLDVLSASPTLRDGDLAAFHAQARAITGERVDAVSLVRPDGVTVLNSRVPPGQPTPAFSVPEAEARRALDEGRTIITPLFTGATSRRTIFAMIKPVTVQGKPHALAVGLFSSRFEPLIDRTLAPWTAGLLDRTGRPAAMFPREGGPIDANKATIAAALEQADHSRLTLKQADGAEHLLTFERIPLSQWVAISSLPRDAVEGPARRAAAIYAVGALLLSVPSALLAGWLGWRLARSMKALSRFAAAMGAEPPSPGTKLPTMRSACRELDVVADRLEKAACDIAARDAQLRQQRDLAERNTARIAQQSAELARSNTDLEQFAYVASHDLREPLRMVSSFLTLLERHLAAHMDAESREYIGFARDGALRMDRMILDLLQYSRVGRVETEIEPVDLNQMVRQATRELAEKIAEAQATITVEETLPTVMGYPGELGRLFQNLIGNAVKYRAADRLPQITIAARHTPEGWEVSVADNGIGIDPQFHQRVFAIFQRLHTRQSYEGNGIGLAICKKAVEHAGGRIWVESQPNEGSVFKFLLPDALPEAPPDIPHTLPTG
ncbi:MAG TPA: ATP-binding protein [Magnetospirillum sp.]|nr:ATP-binding protein [Magnetospirillum sp.]